jgi:3-oxoacyl-[acyl-carrier-protein] synthase II
MMAVKGACQTIIGSRTAGLDALRLAAERIAQGRWDRAIVSAGEESCQTVEDAYRHCGMDSAAGFAIGCGAVTLILESQASAAKRNARVYGTLGASASAAPAEGREIQAAARVLHELGDPAAVLGSANGTWIDRVEAGAARLSSRRAGRSVTLATLSGFFAETFSVTPLLGVAAALLLRRLPGRLEGANAECTENASAAIGVLCTDYSGTMTGVRVDL